MSLRTTRPSFYKYMAEDCNATCVLKAPNHLFVTKMMIKEAVATFPKQTHQQWLYSLLCLFKYRVPDSRVSVSVPKEFSHRETPILQYGAEQLGQVKPDVGNVDGHVIRLLQGVCKPGKKRLRARLCWLKISLVFFKTNKRTFLHYFQEV